MKHGIRSWAAGVRLALSSLVLLGASPVPVRAGIELPAVLGSHMVLQRGVPVPIWGKAAPGEKVVVSFRDQRKEAEADASGQWMVKLDPLDVGDPGTLTVAGANAGTITLTDVLVGEVWVGSGQSNMDTPVSDYATDTLAIRPDAEAGKPADNPNDAASKYHVRDEMLVQLAQGAYPNLRLVSCRDALGWREANPETIRRFSALLFVYGQQLQKELGVPVGLMMGALGATSSEQWIGRSAYEGDAACREALAKFSATYSPEAEQKKYDAALAKWERIATSLAAANPSASAAVPPPPSPDGKPAPERPPWADLPPGVLPPKPLGPFHPGDVTRDLKLPNKNIGDLYELYIRPFIPYAIRGVFWDQGEGGSGICGLDQYPLMGALIRGWRNDWGQGEFPFVYVQKPSGGGRAWDASDPVTRFGGTFALAPLPPRVPDDGAERSDYLRIAGYPRTWMVGTSDLGAGTHPINKYGYGLRAARVALGAVYGRPGEYSGPVFDSLKVEDGKVRVAFTHLGKGLAVPPGEPLQGFAVAGDDKVFSWAEAAIEGDTVVLSSAKVPRPAFVRYAWSRTHPWANLFNADGLPALAFRTDGEK